MIKKGYQISADVDRNTVQIHDLDGNVKDNHVHVGADISRTCDVTRIGKNDVTLMKKMTSNEQRFNILVLT